MLDAFKEIVCVDFEFVADPGERPRPVCMVAKLLIPRAWPDRYWPPIVRAEEKNNEGCRIADAE